MVYKVCAKQHRLVTDAKFDITRVKLFVESRSAECKSGAGEFLQSLKIFRISSRQLNFLGSIKTITKSWDYLVEGALRAFLW